MTSQTARGPAIPESFQFGPMACCAGASSLVDGFMMQIATAIQSMSCWSQDQSRIIGCPALAMALIAGGFPVKTAHEILAMAVLAVALSTL